MLIDVGLTGGVTAVPWDIEGSLLARVVKQGSCLRPMSNRVRRNTLDSVGCRERGRWGDKFQIVVHCTWYFPLHASASAG